MATPTLPRQLADWRVLHENLQPHLDELPQLRDLAAELERIIAEANRLKVRQAVQTARLRQTIADRAAVEARGQEIKTRLRSTLRGIFGTTSIAVLQFGFRPLSGGPRKRRKAKTAPAGPPAAA